MDTVDLEKLIEDARNPNRDIHLKAINALRELKDISLVEPLINALNSNDKHRQWAAAIALKRIADPRAIDDLINVWRDPERTHIHIHVGAALEKIGSPVADRLMKILANEDDPTMRRYATVSLGEMRDARVIESAIAGLSDPDVWMRWGSILALNWIGDPRALPELDRLSIEDTASTEFGKVADLAHEAATSIRQRIEKDKGQESGTTNAERIIE